MVGSPPPPSGALQAWLAAPIRLNTTQNGFMAYWLLLAVPWPRFAAEPDPQGEFTAAADLGAVFDALSTLPRHGRRWSTHWLSFSEAALRNLAAVWRSGGDP